MSAEDLVLETSDDIPMAMSVHSDVLEPQVLTSKIARFVLPNTGILSRDSVFQMQIKTSTDRMFLPLNAGIYSAISRVDLMIGQQTIQTVNSVALYKSITHSYDTPSYRNNFTRIMKGIDTVMKQNGTNINAGDSNKNAGLLVNGGSTSMAFNPEILSANYDMELRTTEEKTPCWSIKIGELFPLLDNVELPLFLINDPVSVVFHLNAQDSTVNTSRKGLGNIALKNYTAIDTPSAVGSTAVIIPETLLFYADYLYYTDERMFAIEESMNASKGMAKVYTDVIQVVNQQEAVTPAPGAATTVDKPFNFQIPVSNYQVKNVFLGWNPNGALNGGAGDVFPAGSSTYNSLLGQYALMNSVKPYNVTMRVNDELIFPQPLVNDPLKAAESSYVYGSPVNLHTGIYSRNGSTLQTNNFALDANSKYYPTSSAAAGTEFSAYGGMNMATQLTGNFHFLGVNLSTLYGDSDRDTELINQKPIEVIGAYPVNDTTNINYNNYAFVEVTKLFAVKNGNVELYDSVNQIQVQ